MMLIYIQEASSPGKILQLQYVLSIRYIPFLGLSALKKYLHQSSTFELELGELWEVFLNMFTQSKLWLELTMFVHPWTFMQISCLHEHCREETFICNHAQTFTSELLTLGHLIRDQNLWLYEKFVNA